MTVLELCSFIRNPKHQEVIIRDYMSVDNEIIFWGKDKDTGSLYRHLTISSFAKND